MKWLQFFIIILLVGSIHHSSNAQSLAHEWSAQISFGKRSYKGDLGNGFLNFNQPFQGYIGVGLSKYISSQFDGYVGVNLGRHGYWAGVDSNFLANAYNVSLEARYKMNNGYLLPKNFPVQPYLSFGLGLSGFLPVDKRGNFAVNVGLPMGIGVAYPLNERLEVFGHWRFTYNYGDRYDGLESNNNRDHILTGEIGMKYNFSLLKDTDGDGVLDKDDRCPNIKGIPQNKGCPRIKKATKEILKEALRGIRFEYDKAIIKPSSHFILDRIVQIMDDHPYYNLTIAGHTSSEGNAEHNLDLSRRRAEAVRKYLIDHDINKQRLTAVGYGEAVPIADNNTLEGKAINRRVEFIIEFK